MVHTVRLYAEISPSGKHLQEADDFSRRHFRCILLLAGEGLSEHIRSGYL